jgi:hypothetical protein
MRSAERFRLTEFTTSLLLLVVLSVIWPGQLVMGSDSEFESLSERYKTEFLPLANRLCSKCHTGPEAEAEIDLAIFQSLDEVRRSQKLWEKVREILDSGQMPPKDASQPTDAVRAQLRNWVRDHLMLEAKANAGDPGPVLLRRLNNAEYTYTIRDLTSIDSLDPAQEFPADSAAGEGFTNTSNALVMSPALVSKYLDAAKRVAEHSVLLPNGFRFSAEVNRRDWTEESLARIRDFYRKHSDASGGTSVDLQGIKFDTNRGGRLPIEKYLVATLAGRSGLLTGQISIDSLAIERGLNPKYLKTLWQTLDESEADQNGLLIAKIRNRWKNASERDAVSIATEIAQWQQALWKLNVIGHVVRDVTSSTRTASWLEPVLPLVQKQDLRLKLARQEKQQDVVLFLTVSDASAELSGATQSTDVPIVFVDHEQDRASCKILWRCERTLGRNIDFFGTSASGTENRCGP